MKTNFTLAFRLKTIIVVLLAVAGFQLSAATYTVTVQNFMFTPDSINANVGDTILFTWLGGSHTTTSTSVPSGAATWDSPMNSSSTTFSYVITQPGTYRWHCSIHTTMTGVIIASGATGIDKKEPSPSSVLVYPKPFTNKLVLDLNNNATFSSNVTVEVYDILGGKKYQHRIGDEVNEPLTMDLSDLPQGVYFVAINNGKDKSTIKVTKL